MKQLKVFINFAFRYRRLQRVKNVTGSFYNLTLYFFIYFFLVSEKGICLPTVFLWLLFVYIEVSVPNPGSLLSLTHSY
jgi:hypothetical protein